MKPIQMSADTAAFDRLFSKEAAFTTATIDTSTFLNVRTPQITSPTADLLISVSGTVTMNAELFTTNGLFLDQASTAGQTFTGTTIGDKLIYSQTEDLYIGPTAVSTNLFLRGTGVAIGANFYPTATGTNGHVLTQTAPGTLALAAPTSSFAQVTTPSIVTSGDMTIDPVGFLFLDSSSTRLNGTTYVSAGSGTLGGNGFPFVTVPVGASSIRAENGLYCGSSGAGLSLISSAGGGIFANYNRIDVKGYGQYYGTAVTEDFVDSYKPTINTGVQGDSLVYDLVTGRFTNSESITLLVTFSYSLRTSSPGTRTDRKVLIRRNGISAAGSEFALTQGAMGDWQSGTATIILAPNDYLQVMTECFGGAAGVPGAYDSYSNITYIATPGV
jgi:hypothetical protein